MNAIYSKIFSTIQATIRGDFNLVLDIDKDKNGGH